MSTSTPVPRPQYASASLYVGDLDPEITEAVLYEFFNSVGPVASIRICRDASTRRSLGYAYVNYHSIADAERALDNLNYTTIKGIPCRIMWCHRDPALRKSGSGNLFVKNLDKSLDNKALYDSFSFFGNILSCKVATDEAGKSRGFGFVHFESEDAARLAIERVNNVKLGNKVVYVGWFQKNVERPSDREARVTNLYVKNFPAGWTETELKPIFEEFGKITSMCVQEDKKKRKFAFINFEASGSAMKAIEELHGRRVTDEKILSKAEGEKAKAEDEAKKVKDAEEEKPAEVEQPETEKITETSTAAKATDTAEAGKNAVPFQFENYLYVQRAQSKAERLNLLRSKFEKSSQQNRQKYDGVNLYIKNLSDDVDDEQLRQMFAEFGTISSAKVMVDERGKGRGFGFVCFSTPDEATRAISEMHLKQVGQKPLYVGLAEKRAQRIARLQQRYRTSQMRDMMPEGEGFGPNYYGAGPVVMNQPNQPNQQMYMGLNMWHPQGDSNVPGVPRNPGMMNNSWKQPGSYGGMPPAPMGMMGQNRGGMVNRRYGGLQQGYPGQHPGPMGPTYNQMNRGQPMAMGGGYPNLQAQQHVNQQATVQQYKQVLGEKLFPRIAKHEPNLAGKITGMMLEMENSELLRLLSNEVRLKEKIAEALEVLEKAKRQENASHA